MVRGVGKKNDQNKKKGEQMKEECPKCRSVDIELDCAQDDITDGIFWSCMNCGYEWRDA